MAAALQIWSATYSKAFDALPASIREAVQSKIDDMGLRLATFAHQRLSGRSECKLRVGDYRILYWIYPAKKLVRIYRIQHRSEAYRSL